MGKIVTIKDDGTHTVEEKSGLLDTTIAGLFAPFGGADKAYTSDIVLMGMGATNLLNTVFTSMYTRKQASAGQKPVLGFMF